MTVPGFIPISEALEQSSRPTEGLLEVPDLKVTSLDEFLNIKLASRAHILAPILPERGLALLFAHRGVGKTYVALGISYAVSTGTSFLRWTAPTPRRVLHVDGEMPEELLQERSRTMTANLTVPEPDYFRLLAMDRQRLGVNLNLALPKHQQAIETHLGAVDFLVLDNISTLVNGGRENDADSWDSMQSWLLGLRRRGITVLLVAHAGRNDNIRGTSKREDVLDTVIKLMRPDDYEPSQGARFEVRLTKARGVFGDAAAPFDASLSVENGHDLWTCRDLQQREVDQIRALSEDGMSVREIAEELGISKSKVNRVQTQLRAEGRL